jgi:hypothetical protein
MSFATAIRAEMPRMLHYLSSQNIPPSGEQLAVIIICQADDFAHLKLAIEDSPSVTVAPLTLPSCLSLSTAKHTYRDSNATPLFLQLLASTPLPQQYANAEQRHIYYLWQTRRALLFGTILTLLLTAFGVLFNWQQHTTAQQTNIKMTTEAADLSQTISALTLGLPANFVPGDDMQKAVLLSADLARLSPRPLTFLAALSHVLDEYPRIHIRQLSWQIERNKQTFPAQATQRITFDGELQNFDTDNRAALDYLADFQEALIDKGYLVQIQSLPIDIKPSGQLSDVIVTQPVAKFSLSLIWRTPE